jgi:cbb3-type cytochrome oxidase maturation protein
MSALLVLIPVSLLLLGIALWAFFWAVNRGQFDDLDTPALRILEADATGQDAQAPAAANRDGTGSAGPEHTRRAG